MIDLDLLRTFVAVAETRGFTRAGLRLHLTQSTVSQQVRRLEGLLGRTLFERDRSKSTVETTTEGGTLLNYARRLLDLANEAENAVTAGDQRTTMRLGVPEDFADGRLTDLLAGFARLHPNIRLDVRSGWSGVLNCELAAADLDFALVKQDADRGGCLAAVREVVVWAVGRDIEGVPETIPLALFPAGCIYRMHAVTLLEEAGHRWRVAFESQGLAAVQAAIASGLGVGPLPLTAVTNAHRTLNAEDGFAPLPPTEIALVASRYRSRPVDEALTSYLIEHLGMTKRLGDRK